MLHELVGFGKIYRAAKNYPSHSESISFSVQIFLFCSTTAITYFPAIGAP